MQNWNKFIPEMGDITDVNKDTENSRIWLNVESLSEINNYCPADNNCLDSSVSLCGLPQLWIAMVYSKLKSEEDRFLQNHQAF